MGYRIFRSCVRVTRREREDLKGIVWSRGKRDSVEEDTPDFLRLGLPFAQITSSSSKKGKQKSLPNLEFFPPSYSLPIQSRSHTIHHSHPRSTTQNATRRSRNAESPLGANEAQRPRASPLVLPSLRKAMSRRERIQAAHDVRGTRATDATRRRQLRQSHRGILAPVPEGVYPTATDISRREGGKSESLLQYLYRG